MGGFFGAVIKAGKATPYVPRAQEPSEPPEVLHISGASIPADCPIKSGTRVSLMVKQGSDDIPICVCTLTAGMHDSMLMSLILDSYAELSLLGPAKGVVHVHGSYTQDGADGGASEDDEDAEGDDEDRMATAKMMEKKLNALIGQPSGLGEVDGEEDEDEEDSEEEDSEESSSGEEDEEDIAMAAEEVELHGDGKVETRYRGSKHVEITDITALLQDMDSGEHLTLQEMTTTKNMTTTQNGDCKAQQQNLAGAKANDKGDVCDEEAPLKTLANEQKKMKGKERGTNKGNGRKFLEEDDEDEDESDVEEDEGEEDDSHKPSGKGKDHMHEDESDDEEDDDEKDEDEEDEDEEDEEDEDEEDEEDEDEEAPVKKSGGQQQAAANRKRKGAPVEDVAGKKRLKHTKFANGFEVAELQRSQVPDAPQAKPGKRVSVKYEGKLQSNGKVFDKTKGNKTFSFRLGVGEVIKGWDKGVAGMRVGDKRRLTVPPSMAYGDTGVKGVIPRNATLCFEVELCGVH